MKLKKPEELIALKKEFQEILGSNDPELGVLMPLHDIIEMSDEEIISNPRKVNEILIKIPLYDAELIRKKWGLDLGIRSFEEKLQD